MTAPTATTHYPLPPFKEDIGLIANSAPGLTVFDRVAECVFRKELARRTPWVATSMTASVD